jgi:beta-N-acetylhexosaminidase
VREVGEVDEPAQPPPTAPLKPRGPPVDELPPPPPRKPPSEGRDIPWLQIIAAVIVGGLAGVIVLGLLSNNDSSTEQVAVSPGTSKTVKGLSNTEKVDSVMAVGFAGTGTPQVAKAQGGIFVGAGNWTGAAAGLNRAIHAANNGVAGGIRPLVIGDQEGGAFRSYPDLPPAESEFDIGAAGDPAKAETWAKKAGGVLSNAGFDLNLFPVADVATLDSPVAGRSFGDDAEVDADMTAAAIRGCEAAGIACAPAHFPGLGAESQDIANGPATVGLTADQLAQRDLLPFRAAFKAGAPAVVLSHAFYTAYDPVTPASTSPLVIGDVLRKQFGFKGVAITDDLSLGAIRGGQGAADASVQAIASGADMVLISDPVDVAAARDALLKAVKKNQISQARLDAAVSRVLELKRNQGLLD